MKKILLISYPFPPIPYSGTFRMIRLCKGLTNLGFEVHVVTINIDDDIPNDVDLIRRIPKSVVIHRTPIIDPWLKFNAREKRRAQISGFRYGHKLIARSLKLITIPDHQILWIPFAVSKGIKVIRRYGIKWILVSSPPNSSQIIGYFIKRLAKVKWLADLRDPIVGNVAEVNLLSPSDVFSRLHKKVLVRLEMSVMRNADAIIANTGTHNRDLSAKFTSKNIYTIRNGFDEDDYGAGELQQYDCFTIAHLGSMYGLRKADILFEAIKRLVRHVTPDSLKMRVLFVGWNDNALRDSVKEHGVERYVEVGSMVSHEKAIEIMMRSHLLLLIKATGKGSYGQIPAKFFEYLGTGNKILYIGPERSEVADLMTELKCGWISDGTEDTMFKTLVEEYGGFLEGYHQNSKENRRVRSQFNCENMAMRLVRVLGDL